MNYLLLTQSSYWLCCVLKSNFVTTHNTVLLAQFNRTQSYVTWSRTAKVDMTGLVVLFITYNGFVNSYHLSDGICINNYYEKFDFNHSYAVHCHLPSVDKPDVISSVFLAACSLMRNSCTRASIELSCSPWSSCSWLLSSLSWQGEVRSWTREATFGLLSSTKLIKSSKL